jgi:hypothetical protein
MAFHEVCTELAGLYHEIAIKYFVGQIVISISIIKDLFTSPIY